MTMTRRRDIDDLAQHAALRRARLREHRVQRRDDRHGQAREQRHDVTARTRRRRCRTRAAGRRRRTARRSGSRRPVRTDRAVCRRSGGARPADSRSGGLRRSSRRWRCPDGRRSRRRRLLQVGGERGDAAAARQRVADEGETAWRDQFEALSVMPGTVREESSLSVRHRTLPAPIANAPLRDAPQSAAVQLACLPLLAYACRRSAW